MRDDGGVVYLNGTEIFRSNIDPTGVINFDTLTGVNATDDGTLYFSSTNLSPALLVPGQNLLAVEIHQSTLDSSDLSFDAMLVAQEAPPPNILVQPAPASQTVRQGQSVTLSVTAGGTPPLTYQWRHNGSAQPGATDFTFTISNANTNDAGSYDVVVSNAGGSVISQVATITVLVPPVIIHSPRSRTVSPGESVGFCVTATGSPPLNYQWFFNDVAIQDATNASLAVVASIETQGTYSVRVGDPNDLVSAGPNSAELAVLQVPPTHCLVGIANPDVYSPYAGDDEANLIDISPLDGTASNVRPIMVDPDANSNAYPLSSLMGLENQSPGNIFLYCQQERSTHRRLLGRHEPQSQTQRTLPD
jgi:hypothetical protein